MFKIAWDEPGNLARTRNFLNTYPYWENIKGNVLGKVNDMALGWNKSHLHGFKDAYIVTVENPDGSNGATLRVYYTPDLYATAVNWSLQAAYSMNDQSVTTSARIATSRTANGLGIVAWKDRTGTLIVRTVDGSTWSAPIRVGDPITDTSHDNAAIGLEVDGEHQIVTAPSANGLYYLYMVSTKTSPAFTKLAGNPGSAFPIPTVRGDGNNHVYARLSTEEMATISFYEASTVASEGDRGRQAFIVLSVPGGGTLSSEVRVTFGTRDGTAVSGEDYILNNPQVVFPAGSVDETPRWAEFDIVDDNRGEDAENFFVFIENIEGPAVVSGITEQEFIIKRQNWCYVWDFRQESGSDFWHSAFHNGNGYATSWQEGVGWSGPTDGVSMIEIHINDEMEITQLDFNYTHGGTPRVQYVGVSSDSHADPISFYSPYSTGGSITRIWEPFLDPNPNPNSSTGRLCIGVNKGGTITSVKLQGWGVNPFAETNNCLPG